jgi:HK97 gp10 family phage protein
MGELIKVTIRGEAELNRKIQQLTARMGKEALVEAVLEGAEIIRADAEARAPVRTGFLKGHINKRVSERKTGRVTVDIGPEKKAWYGLFPELGTIHYAARPYLRPAIDENQDRVVDAVKARLKKEIITAAR